MMRILCHLFGCREHEHIARCVRCGVSLFAFGRCRYGLLPWLWGLPGAALRAVWKRQSSNARYKCFHCGKVVRREATEKRIKSYCTTANREVFLLRMEP